MPFKEGVAGIPRFTPHRASPHAPTPRYGWIMGVFPISSWVPFVSNEVKDKLWLDALHAPNRTRKHGRFNEESTGYTGPV
jgi:hypothetical protein